MLETPDRPRYRLFVDATLAEGATVELAPSQAHYLGTVMRARPGEAVTVFNGRDGEWRSEIATVSKRAAVLTVLRQMRPQAAEPDLWLCFAPLKKDATDMVVQKAVELGVSRLQPVMTARTNASRFNIDRARVNVIEAAEQCERLTVPHVAEPSDCPTCWRDGQNMLPAGSCSSRTRPGVAPRSPMFWPGTMVPLRHF